MLCYIAHVMRCYITHDIYDILCYLTQSYFMSGAPS